jgi:putative transposase
MIKAIKIQLYPNEEQSHYINGLVGTCRFVFNKGLDYKITQYKEFGKSTNISSVGRYITGLKKEVEFDWLNDYHSKVIQQSLLDLDKSYKNFFKLGNGFPKFKSKKISKKSCRFPKDAIIGITGNCISLIKTLKDIHYKCSKRDEVLLNKLPINSITLTVSKSGKYFASIIVDQLPTKQLPNTYNTVGIDMGIKDFITTSDGETFENLKLKRTNQLKLNRLHRNLSRKQTRSNNKNKQRIKLARYYEKLNNIKENYLHHIVNQLLNENQVVVGETLKVSNMLKNHKLARSLQELSIHRFFQILKYKAEWYGREVVQIGQFFPSSKRCNCCGDINTELKLNNRSWECETCGSINDRDLNAARNILEEGLRILRKNTPEFGEIYACGEVGLLTS